MQVHCFGRQRGENPFVTNDKHVRQCDIMFEGEYHRRSNYASFEKYFFCLCNATLEIGQGKLRRKNKKCYIIRNSSCHCCVPAAVHITHRILVVCLYITPRLLVACLSQCWHCLHDPTPLEVLATVTNGGLGLYSAEASDTARAACCSSPHIL